MATKNATAVRKNSAKTKRLARDKVTAVTKVKGKKKRAGRLRLTTAVIASSRLLVLRIGGLAVGSAGPFTRPCPIVGVHGYPSGVVSCNVYGSASGSVSVPVTQTNFRWQATIPSGDPNIPAGDYLVEVQVTSGGTIQETVTFGITLN